MERLVDTQAIRCDSLQLQVGQRESTKAQSQELGLRRNLSPFVQKVYTDFGRIQCCWRASRQKRRLFAKAVFGG
jgi:hypothetical protein